MNEQIFAQRGEDLKLFIDGPERLDTYAQTILPEAACTSTQFHLQVSPDDFPRYWNAAQCLAGVQVALGANSPYFFGKELWRETRIALFEQATDTRPEELKAQGVRPRVWFGERWITSIFDLFEENVRYFPALLPIMDDEDPVATYEAGTAPYLGELRLHNGTIWRWNRPVYDTVGGTAHLRVENRVLPAGPTVVDILANAAFYYGIVRQLATADRPVWSQMSFRAAEDNFHAAAREGITCAGLLAGLWRGAGNRARPATAAAARARGADGVGGRGRRHATACSASSRSVASARPTARPGRPRPCTAWRTSGADRRAALRGMLASVRRAHALERAGPLLAGRLTAVGQPGLWSVSDPDVAHDPDRPMWDDLPGTPSGANIRKQSHMATSDDSIERAPEPVIDERLRRR